MTTAIGRREVLKASVIGAFGASAGMFGSVCCGASGRAKPNIVFVLTDDQGYGDIGRHGHPLLKTPNIDRLYDESVRFDNFYVSPCCCATQKLICSLIVEADIKGFFDNVDHEKLMEFIRI